MATKKKALKPASTNLNHRLRSRVCPDALDLRDRPYVPTIAHRPEPFLMPNSQRTVKNQGNTSACTGFALSTVVEHLLDRAPGTHSAATSRAHISGFMLYSMARRYDEYPGSVAEDSGSSVRGALKGWRHHGACGEKLWPKLPMPEATNNPLTDWWLDAAKRPLGAYYRIDTRAITDMHVAISEVGIIYASAVTHAGWDRGYSKKAKATPSVPADLWVIPKVDVQPEDAGHAFAICGYTELGFIIQNSWTARWGTGGFAILTYEDWLSNAMDAWVAQLGVVTTEHKAVAQSSTLRTSGKGEVKLASSEVLRNRELSPFIIDMGNNGRLSNVGQFRTTPGDVDALVTYHLVEARKKWGLKPGAKVDVAVYAHGGLTGEEAAAGTACKWIPALYEAQVFPIFFMWETGFMSTLQNLISDKVKDVPRTTGGFFDDARDQLKRWWNTRLERAMAAPGTAIWGEMKQNADAMSSGEGTGGVLLYEAFKRAKELNNVRLHLIGHSAGSIVHSFLIDRLARTGATFESVSFMAPAVRVDTFQKYVGPHLQSGKVRQLRQFHLNDAAELADPTCGPYRRSLLYLVSESFEKGVPTPILGMQKYFDPWLAKNPSAAKVEVVVAPGAVSKATSHGGFDDDAATMRRVIAGIKS
jgi:hypothetical protein